MTQTPQGSAQPTIYLGSDHAGFDLKEKLKIHFPQIHWIDCGPANTDRVDYPDFADRVVKEVLKHQGRGVLICGSGQGMAMRANKYSGIRAALVWNEESTRLSRQHNNANVLCLGARLLDHELAFHLFEVFLSTPFEGGRHQGRVEKLGLRADDAC